jgi:hypothetical protein
MTSPSRNLLAATLLLCVTAALAACASAPIKVHTRVDPAASFTGFRTYGFVPVLGTNYGRRSATKWIRAATCTPRSRPTSS